MKRHKFKNFSTLLLAIASGILMTNSCKSKITPPTPPEFLELSNDSEPVNRHILWSGMPFAQISEYGCTNPCAGSARHISVLEDSIKTHRISGVVISFDKNNRLKFITWSAKDDKTGNVVKQVFVVGASGELLPFGSSDK
jgi:hypothetical protein